MLAAIAVSDSIFVIKDYFREIAPAELLANDLNASGANTSVEIVGDPSHGLLVSSTSGELIYQPDVGYSGTDSFTYRTKTNGSFSNVASVQVTVGLTPPAHLNQRTILNGIPLVTNLLSSLSGNVTASIDVPNTVTGQAGISSATIRFSEPVTGFDVSDLILDIAFDDRGNLLSNSSASLSSSDGKTWVLSGIRGITAEPGAYTLLVNSGSAGITGVGGKGMGSYVSSRFVVMPEIQSSDGFLRMIAKASQHFWDHERYTNYDITDGDSLLTLGTIVVSNPANPNAIAYPYDATGNPVVGISGVAGREDARTAYDRLYDEYKDDHPGVVAGSYVAWLSLKDVPKIQQLAYWPTDTHYIGDVSNGCVVPPIFFSAHNDGSFNLQNFACHEEFLDIQIAELLGQGYRPKQDVIHYDEVGYTLASWANNVQLLSQIKQAANANGVLVSTNLGGWGWANKFNLDGKGLGLNVIQELSQMADSLQIEAIWNRNPSANGGTFRNVENTRAIIDNLRAVMDAGLGVMLMPTTFDHDVNKHTISGVSERRDASGNVEGLLVNTSAAHNIFPLGGTGKGRFVLNGLPTAYKFLENVKFSVQEVPGQARQVLLKPEGANLNQLKSAAGIGTIQFSGGQLHDQQASIRMNAALALLAREPGDKIGVHDSPGDDAPGNGDPKNTDNWWHWPQQLGAPAGDYVIDQVETSGLKQIVKMHRDFANGTLEVFPREGYVRIIQGAPKTATPPPATVSPPTTNPPPVTSSPRDVAPPPATNPPPANDPPPASGQPRVETPPAKVPNDPQPNPPATYDSISDEMLQVLLDLVAAGELESDLLDLIAQARSGAM